MKGIGSSIEGEMHRGVPLLGVLVLAATALVGSAATAGPALPVDLPAAMHERLQGVASRAAVSTQVVGETFVARPGLFEYLLDHPQLASDLARTLRFGRYRISPAADGLFLDDGWGAKGTFAVVHATSHRRVVYARGVYESEWLPTIHGQAIVAIDYTVTPAPDGRHLITPTVTGFLHLDNRLADAAARMAGAVAQRQADKKARRLARTFAKTTRAIEADPAGIYALVKAVTTAPTEDVEAFRRLLDLPAGTDSPPQ